MNDPQQHSINEPDYSSRPGCGCFNLVLGALMLLAAGYFVSQLVTLLR